MPSPLNEERQVMSDPPAAHNGAQPFTLQAAPAPMRAPTLLLSFRFAFQGIAYAFRTQRNFKIHCAISAAVIIAGLLLRISGEQWTVLAVVVGLVFQTELTNTAVEAIVDRISPEFNELAKVAKDCSAAAVLVTAVAAVVVGVLIFVPKILALLGLIG